MTDNLDGEGTELMICLLYTSSVAVVRFPTESMKLPYTLLVVILRKGFIIIIRMKIIRSAG